MKKFLPRNLICLDLLVGPFSPGRPREIYIYLTHIHQLQASSSNYLWMSYHWSNGSSCSFLSNKPHISLLTDWPGLTQMTLVTFAPLERGHKCAGMRWVYSCLGSLTIQRFNTESLLEEHFHCYACWPYCLPLPQRTIQPLVQESKLTDIQKWKVYFSSELVNWQTFSPGFPLSPILPGLPSWPWWKNIKQVCKWTKRAVLSWELIEIWSRLLRDLPLHPPVQEAQGVLPFLSDRFHPCLL